MRDQTIRQRKCRECGALAKKPVDRVYGQTIAKCLECGVWQ